MGRGVKAAEHGADIEQQKRTLQYGETANQSGEHAADGADLQRVAPTQAPRQRAARQRPHPHAEDVNADRKRGQTFVRSKLVPTMPAVATNTVLLPPASACVTASTSALRRARRSSAATSTTGWARADIRVSSK